MDIISPRTFIEDTILSPLCVLGTLFKDQLTVDVWVYFWVLYSVSLVYMSAFVLVSYSFDYCSFVIYFEMR